MQDASASAEARAKLMLVLLCLIWGVSWPIMKIALEEIPPFTMRMSSSVFGAVTVALVCYATGRSLRIPDAKTWVHVAVASLLNVALFSALTAFAQLATATSRVAILVYTLPIWSMLLAWPVLRERPSRVQAAALALCAVGLAILIYPLTVTGIPFGVIYALGAAACWGAGTVYVKWARINADPMGAACWQIVIAGVVLGLGSLLFEGGPDFSHAHARGLMAMVLNGMFGNGLAYGLWFTIVGRLPALTASLGVLCVPVVGVVASMLLLGDVPTAADVIGFSLIFAASACILFGRIAPAETISQAT
jgi:drug/metabolite transporter (DMT)-like permease